MKCNETLSKNSLFALFKDKLKNKKVSYEAYFFFTTLVEIITSQDFPSSDFIPCGDGKVIISNKAIESHWDLSWRKRQKFLSELSEFISITPQKGGSNIYDLHYSIATLSDSLAINSGKGRTKNPRKVVRVKPVQKEHDIELNMTKINKNKTTRELVVDSFLFSESSPFKSLPLTSWQTLLNKFEVSQVQDKITQLEKRYRIKEDSNPSKSIAHDPGAILYAALDKEYQFVDLKSGLSDEEKRLKVDKFNKYLLAFQEEEALVNGTY